MSYIVFFKQKTAYEMRISDWSSDVCSSDLNNVKRMLAYSSIAHFGYCMVALVAGGPLAVEAVGAYLLTYVVTSIGAFGVVTLSSSRSEEHTSELRSLMRISYAVFCLKKKTRQIKDAPQCTTPPRRTHRRRPQRQKHEGRHYSTVHQQHT